MFLTEDGELLVNELAPRPHNSGHYTLDLCETSQFEQHIRAVCGLPLGKTDLLKPGMMVNLLGDEVKLALTAGVQHAFVFAMIVAIIGLIGAFFMKRVKVDH